MWRRDDDGNFVRVASTEGQCFALLPLPRSSRETQIAVAGGGLGLLLIKDKKAEVIARHHAYTLDADLYKNRLLLTVGGRDGVFIYEDPSAQTQNTIPIAIGSKTQNAKRNPDSYREQNAPLYEYRDIPEEIHSVKTFTVGGSAALTNLRVVAGLTTNGLLHFEFDSSLQLVSISHLDTTKGIPAGNSHIFEYEGRALVGTKKGLYELEFGGSERKDAQIGRLYVTPCCDFGEIFCDGSGGVFRFIKGFNGDVWITGAKIYHLTPAGSGWVIDSLSFSGLDIGTVRAIRQLQDGRVLIGGDYGFVEFDPRRSEDINLPYSCLITHITTHTAKGDSTLYGGFGIKPEIILPYDLNNITFKFNATNYYKREHLEYAYYLQPMDGVKPRTKWFTWGEWKKDNKKEYTNLPEGEYIFFVMARDVYTRESSEAICRFTILPPFYRTLLFYLYQGGGIVLLFGIALVFTRFLQYGWAGVVGATIGTVAIFIVFEYSQNLVEMTFADVVGEVTLYKVMLNVLCGLLLFPMEILINRMLGIKIVRLLRGGKEMTLYEKGKEEGEKGKLEYGREEREKGKEEIVKKFQELGVAEDVIKKVK